MLISVYILHLNFYKMLSALSETWINISLMYRNKWAPHHLSEVG
jgi:hypothetical protein